MIEEIPASQIHLGDRLIPDTHPDPQTTLMYDAGKVECLVLARATDDSELHVVMLDNGDAYAFKPTDKIKRAN